MSSILNKKMVPSKRYYKARLDDLEDAARRRDTILNKYGERMALILVRLENSDIPLIKRALRSVLGSGAVKQRDDFVAPDEDDLQQFQTLLFASLTASSVRKKIMREVGFINNEIAREIWNDVQKILLPDEAIPLFPNYLDRKVSSFVDDAFSIYTKNYISRISESFGIFVNAGEISPTNIVDAVFLEANIDDVEKLLPEDISQHVLRKHEANRHIARTAARTVSGAVTGITQNAAYLADPNVVWTRWVTRGDQLVRNLHIINGVSNSGLVRKGQPYADGSHICPSGYNCRCYEAAYSEDEVRVANDGVASPIGEDTTSIQQDILTAEERGFEVDRYGDVIDHRPNRQSLYSQ